MKNTLVIVLNGSKFKILLFLQESHGSVENGVVFERKLVEIHPFLMKPKSHHMQNFLGRSHLKSLRIITGYVTLPPIIMVEKGCISNMNFLSFRGPIFHWTHGFMGERANLSVNHWKFQPFSLVNHRFGYVKLPGGTNFTLQHAKDKSSQAYGNLRDLPCGSLDCFRKQGHQTFM